MSTKKKLMVIAVDTAVVFAVFWAIYSIFAPVPKGWWNIPRWWDILAVPLYICLIAGLFYFLKSIKEKADYLLGATVGLIIGLLIGLLLLLVGGCPYPFFLPIITLTGCAIGLILEIFGELGHGLIISSAVILGTGLMFGLKIGPASLLTAIVAAWISILLILVLNSLFFLTKRLGILIARGIKSWIKLHSRL